MLRDFPLETHHPRPDFVNTPIQNGFLEKTSRNP
jgi:hypothetical protein